MTARRKLTAKTPLELREKVRQAEGWKWVEGESRMARVAAVYDLSVDHKKGRFVATPK